MLGGILVDGQVVGGLPIPGLGSLLAGFSTSTVIQGLDNIPVDDQPPVDIVHLAWDTMLSAGFALLGLAAWFGADLAPAARALPTSRWFYRFAAVAGIAAVVALEAGWIVTEVGRQPWVVYGLLRTTDAVTQAPGTLVSFLVVMVVYVDPRDLDPDRPAGDEPAGLRGRDDGRRAVWTAPMSQADLVAGVLWLGITIYAVLGGADFGAGLWDLLAGDTRRGEAPRDLIDSSIGPVWEANHTWLIFDLVILWSAFPLAFASVMSTLFVPLTLAAFGIILRGAGFAFRKYTRRLTGRRLFGATFALSSVITPFFLGTALGAIASGRVPAGNAAGDQWLSWLNPTSVLVGMLAVAAGAYVAAVFLVAAAHRHRDDVLERYFRQRALAAGIVIGALSIAGLLVLSADAPSLYAGLTGRALVLIAASIVLGSTSLVLLARGATRGIRVVAAAAVTAIVWGWGWAQFPAILPGSLTIAGAAAPTGTLSALIVIAIVAALTIGPSLAALFILVDRSRLEAGH